SRRVVRLGRAVVTAGGQKRREYYRQHRCHGAASKQTELTGTGHRRPRAASRRRATPAQASKPSARLVPQTSPASIRTDAARSNQKKASGPESERRVAVGTTLSRD